MLLKVCLYQYAEKRTFSYGQLENLVLHIHVVKTKMICGFKDMTGINKHRVRRHYSVILYTLWTPEQIPNKEHL